MNTAQDGQSLGSSFRKVISGILLATLLPIPEDEPVTDSLDHITASISA
jgi:hypothetical protein